jgi:hypothetical protein
MKCGDCNKCRDYADHSSCDVNKDIYNTTQRGNNFSDFVGLVNMSNFVPKIYRVTNIQLGNVLHGRGRTEDKSISQDGWGFGLFAVQGGDGNNERILIFFNY